MTGETRSADGVTIRWLEEGSGPPLLLVPGGPGSERSFDPLICHLNGSLRCVTMGRRGKGFSDDAPAYAYEREYEDIAAVLDAIGPPRQVFAHSSGAICALGAALVAPVDRLILVEPPLPLQGPTVDAGTLAAVQEALDRSAVEDAVLIALRRAVKHSEKAIATRRASPDWPDLVARRGRGWLRELPEINRLPQGVERYRAIEAPVLLVCGSETAAHHRRAVEALQEALPNARTAMFEGYGHDVPVAAAPQVAAAVLDFLRL
jgi:pimeloyl-ACP methyl ester carboxylesterase